MLVIDTPAREVVVGVRIDVLTEQQLNREKLRSFMHILIFLLYTYINKILFLGCRLTKLQILELRENQLKVLPK